MPPENTTAPAAETVETTTAETQETTPAPAAEPPWAKAREERPARAALKKLGAKITKDVPLDKGVEEIQQKMASQKERRREAEKQRDEARSEAAALKTRLEAVTALQSLDAAQRETITRLAGDDPAKQLEQIGLLKSLLAMQPPATTTDAAAKPIAAPAQSAPASRSPAPPAPPQSATPRDEYMRLRSDPRTQLLAAQYLLDHRGAIVPTS